MKWLTLRNTIALGLLALGGLLSSSCTKCPDCKPTLNCATGNCGPAGPHDTDPAALLSETPCSQSLDGCVSDLLAQDPNDACYTANGCDNTTQLCKLKLKTGKACMTGDTQNCKVGGTGARGVAVCVACNWPDNGCQPCGKLNERCCTGGCEGTYKCKDASSPPNLDLLNRPGSTCK